LARRVGYEPAPRVAIECHRVTGGNPLLVRELLDTVEARGVAIDDVATGDLTHYASDTLMRRTRYRLARLGPVPTRAANALAILGDSVPLGELAAVAELDLQAAADAVDLLVSADLVDARRPASFVHPLLRAAVIDSLAPYERSSLHARAADALSAHGDQESVALHLLASEPAARDDHVTALRRAAALALRRGAPANAAVLLRRALLEPPDATQRALVLRELAEAELREGDPAAVDHLEEVLELTTDPRERAATGHVLARALLFQGSWDRAVEQFRSARASLPHHDLEMAARIDSDLLITTLLDDRTRPADRPDVTSQEIRALAGRPTGRAAALTLALTQALRGNCDDVPDLVRAALADGEFLAAETSDAMAAVHAVDALVFVDDLDDALALARAMVADGERRASVLGVVAGLAHCGFAEYRLGALVDAEADCRAALDLAREHALAFTHPFIASYLSMTLLARGDSVAARAVIESVEPSLAPAHTAAVPTFLEARGTVLLACGDRVGALRDLRACAEAAERLGITNPNVHEWRAGLVEVLQVDDPDEATRVATDNLARAERAGSSRAVGIARRCLAGLAPPSARTDLLRESARALASSPARVERARSLLELGAVESRHGDRLAARAVLLESLQLATECGATKLAEQALEEAHRAGARPRRAWTTGRAALTPAERRVALLAADGRTNQEIAQSLFVTTKTVKAHLGSVYRKLSVSRRTDLRGRL
jgi:DNA-binding CsgD family transcriptional regulator